MGWENEHLNQIIQGQETFYVPFYQHDPDCDWGDHRYQEEYMLSDLLREKGMTVRWEYDFGDGWQHEIRLSSISEYEADEPRAIIFKSGKYVCPPEDCGGIWGYQDLLDLHAKRKAHKRLTSDEKERLEWYGIDKDYDPEEDFDKDECIDICDEFSCNDDSDALIATRAKTPSQIGGKQSGSINDDVDPFITSPLYDEVLSLAFRLRELEPWEDLDDSDVYAIRMQDGSEMYIATMGNGSGMKDIQFYDGAESFQQYLCYLNGPQLLHFDIMDLHCWANYTSILFPDAMEKAADAAYYTHIKQWADTHNKTIKPECGYPLLQRYRPHRYQSMMLCDEQGLARLKEALEAVLWLSQQLLDTDDLATLGFVDGKYPTKKGGKVVPLVIKTSEGYRIERTKLPGLCEDFPTVSIPESDLQSLRTLRKSGTQYCRLIHIPELIDSEDDRENSNFPLILACIDKNQDIASMTEPCEMSNDYERDVLRQYINKVREEGKLPQRIVTDHPRTYAFLRDFCHTLGTILELKRVRIPELNELCQYMCEFKL